MADVSVVVERVADGQHGNVALQLAHFAKMAVDALAMYGSVEQFSDGDFADAEIVAVHLAHAFGHAVAVLELFNAGVGADDVLCHSRASLFVERWYDTASATAFAPLADDGFHVVVAAVFGPATGQAAKTVLAFLLVGGWTQTQECNGDVVIPGPDGRNLYPLAAPLKAVCASLTEAAVLNCPRPLGEGLLQVAGASFAPRHYKDNKFCFHFSMFFRINTQ